MSASLSRGEMFAEQAESWIDVPFHWQGRVRAGCDCKGLLAGVAAELGFPEAESLEALAGDYGEKVPDRRLQLGMARLFDPVGVRRPTAPLLEGGLLRPTAPPLEGDGRRPGDVLLCLVRGVGQHLAIAAPRPGRPHRAIEAVPHVGRVRPIDWAPHRVASIWRWKV